MRRCSSVTRATGQERNRRKYLVGGHRERENVALLRIVAAFRAKPWWIQQFWSHIMDNSLFGCCRAVSLHDRGVGNDCCDSKVSETRIALLGDQDVSLNRSKNRELVRVCLR